MSNSLNFYRYDVWGFLKKLLSFHYKVESLLEDQLHYHHSWCKLSFINLLKPLLVLSDSIHFDFYFYEWNQVGLNFPTLIGCLLKRIKGLIEDSKILTLYFNTLRYSQHCFIAVNSDSNVLHSHLFCFLENQ